MRVSGYSEYQRGLHDDREIYSRPPIKRLGPRRGLLSVVLAAVGSVTFFLPLIGTDPAAIGLTKWSFWGILRGIQSGTFPGLVDSSFVVTLGFLYAVLLIDLIGLLVSPIFSVPKIQAIIALVGLGESCHAKFSYFGQKHWNLTTMFYGEGSGHVNLDRLLTNLILILVALLLVSLDAMFDAETVPDTTGLR